MKADALGESILFKPSGWLGYCRANEDVVLKSDTWLGIMFFFCLRDLETDLLTDKEERLECAVLIVL